MAFPVMTLAFHLNPSVARDFSLLIQSVGMSAASYTIFFIKVRLEWHTILLCSIGGGLGMILGLEVIDPLLSPSYKKMIFVSIWFSFAFALFLVNRYHDRRVYARIPDFRPWKGVVLMLTGVLGGIFTSFSGSGLDICSFSILTLLFRVSEKTATPTSVLLMAGNSLFGSYWRLFMMGKISGRAFEYLAVSVPVVVVGAPLGSLLGTHFHRLVLAAFVYVIDTVALISAFCIVPQTPLLAGVSVAIIVVGFAFFFVVTKVGEKIMLELQKRRIVRVLLKYKKKPLLTFTLKLIIQDHDLI